MRPTRLKLRNFMPYGPQPTELDLNGIRLACLAGENGHGKSAIIDAITWALWGKARARRDDELIHLGEEQMEVSLDFALGDQTYRVIRQRDSAGRGSSALEFQVGHNGHFTPLTEATIRETQERIIDTLHLDYETFTNSALLLQGKADEFTNQPPGERKRILGEILGLGLYDELETRAKEKAREAEGRLTGIDAKASGMEEELSRLPDHEADLEAAASEAERLGEELKEAQEQVRQLREKQTEGSLKRQALDDAEGERGQRQHERDTLRSRILNASETSPDEIEHQLQLVREKLSELDGLERERREAREGREEASQQVAVLETTNATLKQEMQELREEMDTLSGAEAECPLCGAELEEEYRDQLLTEKQEAGTEKAGQYNKNKAALTDLQNRVRRFTEGLAGIDEILRGRERQRQKESALTQKLAEAKAQADRIDEWKEQVKDLEDTIADATAKRDALKVELGGLAEIETELRTWKAKENQLGDQVSRANLRVGAATQKIEHCQYLKAEKEKLEAEQEEAARDKALYDELRLAFGRRGIQAMIIETVLPEIEDEANRLLQAMTDGRMSVAFESQRETKKGTIAETLDIHVADELGTRSYDLFSGGEAFRINFAIRVAISRLLARRAGAQLQTLIMDEGFGSQDGRGRDRLVEAINSVAGDFGLILVVTHIDELKEAFQDRIEVVKGPAGSLISVN